MTATVTDGGLGELGSQAWSTLDALARALSVPEARLQPTLDAIVSAAAGTIVGGGHAGIILMVDGVLVPQAVQGRPPEQLDALQQQTGRGPCIEAAVAQRVVHVTDTATARRWGSFGRTARELGVGSILCVPLRGREDLLGTLSLYGSQPGGFDDFHLPLAQLCATHAALALGEARRTEQLHAALANRDVIGQAKGILMERHRLTAEGAFERLAGVSQALNTKLVDVARQLATTGELPNGGPFP